jgi:hypothetical protein
MLESRWQSCKRPRVMLRFLQDRASPRKLRLFACGCCRRLWPWLRNEASRQAVQALELQANHLPAPRRELQAVQALARQGVQAAQEVLTGLAAAARETDARDGATRNAIWVGEPPEPALLLRNAADAAAARAAEEEAQVGWQAAELIARLAEESIGSEELAREAVQRVVQARLASMHLAWSAGWLHRAEVEAERPVSRGRASLRAAQAVQWIEREETDEDRIGRIEHRAEVAERRAQCDLLRDLFGDPFHPVVAEPDWQTWNKGCVVNLARAIYDQGKFQDLPILADALEEAGCDHPDILSHCRTPRQHTRGCWVLDLLTGAE